MRIDEQSYIRFAYEIEGGGSREAGETEGIIGLGVLLPGLAKGLLGMTQGEKKTFTIAPEDAFGPHEKDRVQEVPVSDLPPGFPLELNVPREAVDHMGRHVFLRVIENRGDVVVLDLNHPLAGATLTATVEVLEARPSTPEDVARLENEACGASCDSHEGGCGGCSGCH